MKDAFKVIEKAGYISEGYYGWMYPDDLYIDPTYIDDFDGI